MQNDAERLYDAQEYGGSTSDNAARQEGTQILPTTDVEHHDQQQSQQDETGSVSDISSVELNGKPKGVSKRFLILEPVSFMVFMATFLSNAVYQNQILYQTCVAVFDYDADECEPLLGKGTMSPEAQRIETEVQPYGARIIMTKSVIDSIMPALLSLFIGPWSDKYGRKPILVTTVLGCFVGYVILSILALVSLSVAVSPWLFLLSCIPTLLTGGMCAYVTATYSYISDKAPEQDRVIRMIINDAMLGLGLVAGNVAGGYIYTATNGATVFFISSMLTLLSLIYVTFCTKDCLEVEDVSLAFKLRAFFRPDLLKDLLRTCVRKRPNFDREFIWLTMTALTISIFTLEGDNNVTYLFLRCKFDFTLKDFTLFNTKAICIQIVGCVFCMLVLRKVFHFSIISTSLVSLGGAVLESTVRATAVHIWEMYIGVVLNASRGVINPMARAILSHVAPANEFGKIFALTTAMETISPLLAAPLYTTVYNATLDVYPGLFNFISAALYLLAYTLIAIIFGMQKSLGPRTPYHAIGS